MEEKKKAPAQDANHNQQKLSYEKLQQVAGDLYSDNQKLSQKVQQLQAALNSRDFDYLSFFMSSLFKVMEHPEMYSDEFVQWSAENIETSLKTFAASAKEEAEADAPSDEKKDEA